jgi:hypothetical protein
VVMSLDDCGTGQEVSIVSRRAVIGKRTGGARDVEREGRAHDKRAGRSASSDRGRDGGRRWSGVNVDERIVGHLERADVTGRAGEGRELDFQRMRARATDACTWPRPGCVRSIYAFCAETEFSESERPRGMCLERWACIFTGSVGGERGRRA